jgi:DtxR family transcriptional regulator, Mn-dependent transcriptional regulator
MAILTTQTEENYLKAIFKIAEREEGKAVLTNAIAAAMNTAAASVTDMLKRLAEKQLISYEKYRGVNLTDDGHQLATMLIRKHRLWETFLVKKLGFPWEQVHELAEQLEHIQGDALTARLDQFLGYPRFDPHGDPIPDANGRWEPLDQIPLAAVEPGERGKVSNVGDDSSVFLQYLNQLGLALGSEIEVLERFAYDNSIKVRIGVTEAVLSEKVCQNLYVK